jgi:hypothetical protein
LNCERIALNRAAILSRDSAVFIRIDVQGWSVFDLQVRLDNIWYRKRSLVQSVRRATAAAASSLCGYRAGEPENYSIGKETHYD